MGPSTCTHPVTIFSRRRLRYSRPCLVLRLAQYDNIASAGRGANTECSTLGQVGGACVVWRGLGLLHRQPPEGRCSRLFRDCDCATGAKQHTGQPQGAVDRGAGAVVLDWRAELLLRCAAARAGLQHLCPHGLQPGLLELVSKQQQ